MLLRKQISAYLRDSFCFFWCGICWYWLLDLKPYKRFVLLEALPPTEPSEQSAVELKHEGAVILPPSFVLTLQTYREYYSVELFSLSLFMNSFKNGWNMTREVMSYLHHFPLWTFRKDQDLVVKRIQRLPDWLGLLLGHADAVLQEVNFDVGRWKHSTQTWSSRTLLPLQRVCRRKI